MALIKCKECGHDVSDKASTCPNCGCPVEKRLICNECGNSVSPSDKSCPKCGNPIKSESCYNWKKPILSIVVLLLVLGGAYGVWQLIGSIGKDRDIELTNALSKSIRKYDALTSFHEGFAAVVKEGKWGYINSDGEEVIPCKYDGASPFSEGLACVYIGDDDLSIEFIDEKGNTLIKGYRGFAMNGGMTYEPITFRNGVCCVSDKEHNDVWIDKKGNKVNEPQNYDEVFVNDGTERFEEEGKVGVKDTLGNVLIKAKYSYVDNYSQGLAVAYLQCGNKVIYGYVDKKGNSTFTDDDFAERDKYEMEQKAKRALEEAKERERKAIVGTYIFHPRKDNYTTVDMYNGQKWWKERKLVGYIEWTEYLVVMDDYRVSLLAPSRRNYVGTVSDVANGAFVISTNNRESMGVGAWTTLYKNGKDIGRLGEKGYGYPNKIVIDTKTRRIYKKIEDYKNKDISDVEYIMYDSFSSVVEESNNTEMQRNYFSKEYEREYGM